MIMLTLTVDPKQFDGPEEAFRWIKDKRKVAELIRKLNRDGRIKTREFTQTIEFHENGWPHYHILVESRFVEKHYLQNAWKIGHVWISKNDFEDVGHAINYATKYIVKTDADDGFAFPEWVLQYRGKIRRFSTSRGLCKTRKVVKKEPSGKTRENPFRTAKQITAKCGETTKIIQKNTLTKTIIREGEEVEVKKHWHRLVGVLELDWDTAQKKDVNLLIHRIRVQQWNEQQSVVPDDREFEVSIQNPERMQKVKVHRYGKQYPTRCPDQ